MSEQAALPQMTAWELVILVTLYQGSLRHVLAGSYLLSLFEEAGKTHYYFFVTKEYLKIKG